MKSFKILMMAALTILSAGAFAQDTTMKAPKQKTEKVKYSCPMHPAEISEKPGKCSKCGTLMNRSLKEKMKMEVMKTYTCPMHPDVTGNKPGKCSKCNMDLMEKKEDHSNHQH